MKLRSIIYAAAITLIAGATLLTTDGGALAGTVQGGMAAKVAYETDTGSGWYLDSGPATHTDAHQADYGDAGIVYDLGKASQFTGITFSGTGQLAANVWISKGVTDANSKYGVYHDFVTDPVDFAYGFGDAQNHPGLADEFWMTTKVYGLTGTLTAAQIQALGDDYEVYAWVGISGSTSQVGHVDALPGVHPAANLSITITDTGNTATAR